MAVRSFHIGLDSVRRLSFVDRHGRRIVRRGAGMSDVRFLPDRNVQHPCFRRGRMVRHQGEVSDIFAKKSNKRLVCPISWVKRSTYVLALRGIIRHFLRIVPYHKKTVRHRMRLSVIFDDWSIIFTFMFNTGKNLSVMKGKMSFILKKMSITGQKMSIIAPGVHHRPRYVQNPVPIGHCPAPIPFSNCRRMPFSCGGSSVRKSSRKS